jgi:hypothetical protein
MRRRHLGLIAASLSLMLIACKRDEGGPPAAPPNIDAPAPPGQTTTVDVDPCLIQMVRPGVTVASLVIPDTLTLDFTQPPGFPNGRRLEDSVVDLILAMLLLDLTKHGLATFVNVPVNPPANDRPFRPEFPFLAPPQGNPPIAQPLGQNFNFRTDPESAYVRVDRTGFPALATALIPGPLRNAFNDDSNPDDLTFKWVPEFRKQLILLTNALGDDIEGLGLKLCAKRI